MLVTLNKFKGHLDRMEGEFEQAMAMIIGWSQCVVSMNKIYASNLETLSEILNLLADPQSSKPQAMITTTQIS